MVRSRANTLFFLLQPHSPIVALRDMVRIVLFNEHWGITGHPWVFERVSCSLIMITVVTLSICAVCENKGACGGTRMEIS